MSVSTRTAGYPVHAVVKFARWTSQHGVCFTDWAAACGASGCLLGRDSFGFAGSARRRELCASCFPGRDWNGYRGGDPVELSDRDELRGETA